MKRFTSSPSKGLVRTVWNLRSNPVNNVAGGENGFLVAPGSYFLNIVSVSDQGIDTLVKGHAFEVKGLNNQTLVAKDPLALDAFRKRVSAMNRKVHGVGEILGELESQVGLLESLLLNYPGTSLEYVKTLRTLKKEMDSVKLVMYGDPLLAKHEFESAPSLNGRLGMVEYMLYDNTAGATKTQEVHLSIIEEIYPTLEVSVKGMLQQLEALEDALAKGPIPYTRNRGLKWKLD